MKNIKWIFFSMKGKCGMGFETKMYVLKDLNLGEVEEDVIWMK